MGTESETTTTDTEEELTPEESENKLINDLRKQLRAKDKELNTLRPLKETNAYLEAGLGSLSDDQKTALRAVAGEELTKEILQEKAKSLGFIQEAPDPEEQQIQGEVQTINNSEKVIKNPTAKPDNRSFNERLQAANSQDEIMALLASEGEEHGLLVEDEF